MISQILNAILLLISTKKRDTAIELDSKDSFQDLEFLPEQW